MNRVMVVAIIGLGPDVDDMADRYQERGTAAGMHVRVADHGGAEAIARAQAAEPPGDHLVILVHRASA